MFDIRQRLQMPDGNMAEYFSLPRFEERGHGALSRLPVSLRIVLESVLRNIDGRRIRDEDALRIAGWQPTAPRSAEVPLIVGRVLLQDFTGVPLLVDLAAMRAAVARQGGDVELVQPTVPVDLVIDHSVQVDFSAREDAELKNIDLEFRRNEERYRFLKWGTMAFDRLRIVPSGFGICHQVNLEFLAGVALVRDGVVFPDTLVGTDSHTTMVNGLGVLGWGVGGIEAEAAMLGQPVSLLMPDVVGVHLHGTLREGVTATDLVLHITEALRATNVVGKFVEFHGSGAARLSVADRATLGNMAPEYGATVGFFPVDDETCRYLRATGRSDEHVELVRRYFQAQGLFGIPAQGECDYTSVINVDLSRVEACVAGPARPQDRIALPQLKTRFLDLLTLSSGYGKPAADVHRRLRIRPQNGAAPKPGGGEQSPDTVPVGNAKNTSTLTEREMMNNRPTPNAPGVTPTAAAEEPEFDLAHGDIVIAAITSCTNTSNPAVMLGAGLLAKKAVERGLQVKPWVKTSLAPGSRVVSEYLKSTGLQPFLDSLGFQVVAFGCTTCIGNSGPLAPEVENALTRGGIIGASVLSGNRNFEARIHQSVKANFLMSPPLVIAFAIAGRVDIDLTREPLGIIDGAEIFLRDIWPSTSEVAGLMSAATNPLSYQRVYGGLAKGNALWNEIRATSSLLYAWEPGSQYIREPPYFSDELAAPAPASWHITGARALAVFGDSLTTDHISPAGAIKPGTPAADYLVERGVSHRDFNSYGARRGNHEVMVRGTFANVRIRNLMAPGTEGAVTVHQPTGDRMGIYDAAARYRAEQVPLLVIAGKNYGAGSSRDWAAKGTRLLGVRVVVAQSFERIHRSNLIGMGVLPCELPPGVSAESLEIDGTESFDLPLGGPPQPGQSAVLTITHPSGRRSSVDVVSRVETATEAEYLAVGGILPFMLEQLRERDAARLDRVATSQRPRTPPTRPNK